MMFKFQKNKMVPAVPAPPFDEKEMVFGLLRNDPKIMSHVWGAQIFNLQQVNRDHTKAQQLINCILEDIGKKFADDPGSLSRIMRTMLKTYQVDIEFEKVPAFDRIHSLIAAYVEQHYETIEVYQ